MLATEINPFTSLHFRSQGLFASIFVEHPRVRSVNYVQFIEFRLLEYLQEEVKPVEIAVHIPVAVVPSHPMC
jgi:hypothetical protein